IFWVIADPPIFPQRHTDKDRRGHHEDQLPFIQCQPVTHDLPQRQQATVLKYFVQHLNEDHGFSLYIHHRFAYLTCRRQDSRHRPAAASPTGYSSVNTPPFIHLTSRTLGNTRHSQRHRTMWMLRVTGAWTGLLRDWLDKEGLAAITLRAALARWALKESVPAQACRTLLEQAVALVPDRVAPELAIGAGVT